MKPLTKGALIGALAGGVVGLCGQVHLRMVASPWAIFPGATQGLDQWTYFSMCRAFWRSPTFLTYSYPYDLDGPTPPVLFQFPLFILAWIGWVTGLPAAFELGRVAGAAGSGAALAWMGTRLIRGRSWRACFWVAAVLGGGLFTWGGVVSAFKVSGAAGLTELYEYLPHAAGPIYWWAPYPAQNLRYPLECIYHALVFGALAALAGGFSRTALLLGALTWVSNPFSAVALSAAALPYWAWMAWDRRRWPSGRWKQAAAHGAGWTAVTGLALLYYGPFLGQWPALAELRRLYHSATTPPLSALQFLMLGGPWLAGLLWSVLTVSGRRHVWGRPAWRLFGLVAVTQIVLIEQHWILGERALQPFHYNRGYLHLALVVLSWRAAAAWSAPLRRRGRVPRALLVIVVLTLGDQSLFAVRTVLHNSWMPFGEVEREYADVVAHLDRIERESRLVFVEPYRYPPSYLAAFSRHVPFSAPETMVVPFPERRQERIDRAMKGENGGVAALGAHYAVIGDPGGALPILLRQGWAVVYRSGQAVLLRVPTTEPATPAPERPPREAGRR